MRKKDFRDDLKKVRRILRALIRGIESSEYTLEGVIDGTTETSAIAIGLVGRLKLYQRILEWQGRGGARFLEVRWLTGGGASVRIDASDWIRLTPRQAQLIAAAAGQGAKESEALPEWVATQEIARRMGEMSGKPVSVRSLPNLCLRLRKTLLGHLVNPFYLHSREGAIRFAVRVVGHRRAAGAERAREVRGG